MQEKISLTTIAHLPNETQYNGKSPAGGELGILAEYPSKNNSHGENRVLFPKDLIIKSRFKLLKTARNLLPHERIAHCQHTIAPGCSHVVGQYNSQTERARYTNLVRCESYSCPVCAWTRSEQDRHELSVALAEAQKREYYPVMVTFTLSHHLGDALEDLRYAVASAFDEMFSGRWYQDLKKAQGLVGKIKVWEARYGGNGWHPHLHVLMFIKVRPNEEWLEDFENTLTGRWLKCLDGLGYHASWENGLKVTDGYSEIADYIAKFGREPKELEGKWGADSEMAKAPVKESTVESLTPFQLLEVAAGQFEALKAFWELFGACDADEAKKRAAALYCEYFRAFKGRVRIKWGSMREILEMNEALAEYAQANPPSERDDPQDVVLIERGDWVDLTKRNLEADLLIEIRSGDVARLKAWLHDRQVKVILVGEHPPPEVDT